MKTDVDLWSGCAGQSVSCCGMEVDGIPDAVGGDQHSSATLGKWDGLHNGLWRGRVSRGQWEEAVVLGGWQERGRHIGRGQRRGCTQ